MMVLCVKVPAKKAQEVKRFLVENDLFDQGYRLVKEGEDIFFPIARKSSLKKTFPFAEFVVRDDPRKSLPKRDMKSLVLDKLTEEERSYLRRAYDSVGSIAILEIPDELRKKEKVIADALLQIHRSVRTVLKKAGFHETEFRTQKMIYLAGEKTKETMHTEHGVKMLVDVEKVYFSPRLASERKRVASQVKKGENVLVMFSGCAPYPCVIAKKTGAKEIVGIELNPDGHDYGVRNVELNRIRNVSLINGDAADVKALTGMVFDRIVMPLPKTAADFLDSALSVSKKGTVVHFYAFREKGDFDSAKETVQAACRRNNMGCRILRTVRCGQQSPKVYRLCVDFRVS